MSVRLMPGQGRLWTGTWSMINRPVRRWKKMGKSGVDQVLVGELFFVAVVDKVIFTERCT